MKHLLIGITLFAFNLSFAQTSKNVGEFSSLKVYDKIKVELVPANENKVEVSGSEESNLETVNKNGELKIRMTTLKTLQGDDLKVKIYYISLNDIQASQGSVITSEQPVESNILNLVSNEGSKISIQINSERLVAKTNSGGEINVSGTADSQDITVTSGAKFLGQQLDSRNAIISTNAGGVAEVFADKSVEATTRAGGRIEVYGNPEDRKVKKVAGGKVNFK